MGQHLWQKLYIKSYTNKKKTHQRLQSLKACTSTNYVCVKTSNSSRQKMYPFNIYFHNNKLYLDTELHFYYLICRFVLYLNQ